MKIKPEKIALIIVTILLSTILIGAIIFGIVLRSKKNDYKFQQLLISLEDGYFDDITYEESTKTLNSTLNVRMILANQTNKDIGIDTNILSLHVRDSKYLIDVSESVYLNNRGGYSTNVGDHLGEKQYQTIKANDVSVIKFSIPVSITFNTDNTNSDLRGKLGSLSIYWHSNYFNQVEHREIDCSVSHNINRI